MSEPVFTIAQIRRYLEGCLLIDDGFLLTLSRNNALNNAIRNLQDDEDGIAAVTRRAEPEMKESVDP